MTTVTMIEVSEKEAKFYLPGLETDTGEVLVWYIRNNDDIVRAGYKMEGKTLVVAVQTNGQISPKDGFQKGLEDVQKVLAEMLIKY